MLLESRQPIGIVQRVELVGSDEHGFVGKAFAGGIAPGEELGTRVGKTAPP